MRRENIWQKAVDWIANSDSRVRVESRMIAGEQFTVWRWIQSDPPATEVKYIVNTCYNIHRHNASRYRGVLYIYTMYTVTYMYMHN